MKKNYLKESLCTGVMGFLFLAPVHAGTPLWTYSAPNPATTTVSSGDTATVQYTITNQFNKPRSLILKATPGLSALPCSLAGKGSTCTLTLTVNGSTVPAGGINAGPDLCEQGNPNQCYRPSRSNQLRIILTPKSLDGIYAETLDSLVTYSPDSGVSWGYMLSPQGGWSQSGQIWAAAVTSDGTMYQATTVFAATGLPSSLIYSSDGVNWKPTLTFPNHNAGSGATSVFAVGNTVYVGTNQGYVFSTTNQGISWLPVTPAQVLDNATVTAIVVDGGRNYYAGTQNGNIYYSTDSGQSWSALNNPSGGGSIKSLAIDASNTLYAITSTTTTQPQYNSAPLTSGTWQSMTALPLSSGNATAIAASGSVVYVGTDNSTIAHTLTKGQTWSENQLPNDTSGITSLFVKQGILSPLFVESYGTIRITGASSTGSITITNFSKMTVTNVRAKASQLPAGVSSSSCASVVAGGNCNITLTATPSAKAFAPTTFDIIDGNNRVVSRSAVVSSISPDSGLHYYYVYSVSAGQAYVLDDTNATSSVIWSSNNTGTTDYTSIWGISEGSTSSVPNPQSTQYLGQSNCEGATDGSCNSANILVYYNDIISGAPINTSSYAAGFCSQSTAGDANAGDWYLPSACELNGGLYLNQLTGARFVSCSPMLTGASSLYELGALGGALQGFMPPGFYWSSTEYSNNSQNLAWQQSFTNGAGGRLNVASKGSGFGVRCARAIPLI